MLNGLGSSWSLFSNKIIFISLYFINTELGLYFNISPIKAIASSFAPGIKLFKCCLSCFGNLNPTCEANLYPSAHSSFVGVPFKKSYVLIIFYYF